MATTEPIQIPIEAIDNATRVVENFGKNVSEATQEVTTSNKGASASFTELNSVIGVVKQTYSAVAGAVKDVYGSFSKAAEATRDLALASGTTATEASTLLQVLDDYQISADDVTAASKRMKENGLVPTLETLAQLSDQFLAIQDPAERLKFAQDNLGKSYSKYLNVLQQGGDVLRQNAADVNQNLILNDQQIASYEKQRLALDALSDTWEGWKVQLGAGVGQIIITVQKQAELTDRTEEYAKAHGIVIRNQHDAARVTELVRQEMNAEATAAAEAASQTMMLGHTLREYGMDAVAGAEMSSEALKELSATNAQTINDAIAMQSANDNYQQSQAEISQKLAEERAKLDELNQGYYAFTGANAVAAEELANVTNRINEFIPGVTGSAQELKKLQETQAILNDKLKDQNPELVKNTDEIEKQTEVVKELQDAQNQAAQEFEEAMNRKLAMLALEKIALSDGVAGYNEAEMAKAEALLNTAGIAEDSALRQTLAFEKASSAIANSADVATAYQRTLEALSNGYNINVVTNWINTGAPPTTTAGGANAALGPHVTENSGRAKGGPLANGWTLVGDLSGGRLTPYSELISPSGMVYDAKTTKWLIQSGLVGGFSSMANAGDLGGGGVSNPKPNPIPPAPQKPRSGSKAGGSSAGSVVASSAAAVQNMTVAVEEQVAQSAAMTQQMQQAITTSIENTIGQNTDVLNGIYGLLVNQPRDIGKVVAYEVTKNNKN